MFQLPSPKCFGFILFQRLGWPRYIMDTLQMCKMHNFFIIFFLKVASKRLGPGATFYGEPNPSQCVIKKSIGKPKKAEKYFIKETQSAFAILCTWGARY